MLTFLLDEYKDKAAKAYHLRLWSLYLGLFTLVLSIGFALAIPEFAILRSKRSAALLEKAAASSPKDASKPIASEVKAIKDKVAVIKDISSKQPMAAILERALALRGSGIAITSISLTRGGQPGAIAIGGTASTRDSLVAFSKRLQNEPSFSNASLPVSSLAKNKDIPFSISIDSKF